MAKLSQDEEARSYYYNKQGRENFRGRGRSRENFKWRGLGCYYNQGRDNNFRSPNQGRGGNNFDLLAEEEEWVIFTKGEQISIVFTMESLDIKLQIVYSEQWIRKIRTLKQML